MLSSLFGKKKSEKRVLNHPRDLQAGDLVKFKLFAPDPLNSGMFEVAGINTYDYKTEKETEFVLKNATGTILFMTVDVDDQETSIQFSRKITRQDVSRLFSLDEFAQIFDVTPDEGQVTLKRQEHDDATFNSWTAPSYVRTEYSSRGYYYEGDYRQGVTPSNEDNEFDLYVLTSDDEKYAVSIEVYDDGDEVSLSLIDDGGLIEEMWPKEAADDQTS